MTTATNPADDGRTVMLKGVRLSFTDSLKDAKPTIKGGVAKHTCNVLIEADGKNTAENKAKIIGAIQAACVAEFGEGKGDFFKVVSEDNPMRVCYRKGERFKNSETQEVYKGYAGNMVIAGSGPGGSKNPRRPQLRNRRKKLLGEMNEGTGKPWFTVEDIPALFYSGVYADVKVSFYAVSGADNGGNGVFCSLEAIRTHEEGERMAGGHVVTTEDEFDDLDDDDDLDSGSTSSTAASDDDFG